MVGFNKLVLRTELPNSSSVRKRNQIEPTNFSQPIFWGLYTDPRNDQLLKVPQHLSLKTAYIGRPDCFSIWPRRPGWVTRRLSNVGRSCRKQSSTPLNNVCRVAVGCQALTWWLEAPSKEVAVLAIKEDTGQRRSMAQWTIFIMCFKKALERTTGIVREHRRHRLSSFPQSRPASQRRRLRDWELNDE